MKITIKVNSMGIASVYKKNKLFSFTELIGRFNSIERACEIIIGRKFKEDENISPIRKYKSTYTPKRRGKKVIQMDMYNNFIQEWRSATEAAISLNLTKSCISQCAKGTNMSGGGFKWKYSKGDKK